MNTAKISRVRKKEINLSQRVDLYYGVDISEAFTDYLRQYEFDEEE